MKKICYTLMMIMLALNMAACASAPSGNTSEQQRKNAREAQDELSTDVNRGAR